MLACSVASARAPDASTSARSSAMSAVLVGELVADVSANWSSDGDCRWRRRASVSAARRVGRRRRVWTCSASGRSAPGAWLGVPYRPRHAAEPGGVVDVGCDAAAIVSTVDVVGRRGVDLGHRPRRLGSVRSPRPRFGRAALRRGGRRRPCVVRPSGAVAPRVPRRRRHASSSPTPPVGAVRRRSTSPTSFSVAATRCAADGAALQRGRSVAASAAPSTSVGVTWPPRATPTCRDRLSVPVLPWSADGLRTRHPRGVRRRPDRPLPRGRGRARHGRRGPRQRVLRRRRALDARGRDAPRPPQPAAALRVEARWLPARRSAGHAAPSGGAARGVGRDPAVTASGSVAAERAGARVAAASRIWVEGRHDAELVEHVWGDELRDGGIVVEPLHGADHLVDAVAAFAPSPQRRLGVLLDHLVPGSKERRLADQVSGPLRARHRASVRRRVGRNPAAACIGIDAWPDVPPGEPWKEGLCRALGTDVDTFWPHLRNRVRSYADLRPELVGAVEQLLDFVTGLTPMRSGYVEPAIGVALSFAPMAQVVARGPVSGSATKRRKRKPFLLDLYSTAVGKKYVMAITGPHRRRLRRRPHDRQPQDVLRSRGHRPLRRVAARAARAGCCPARCRLWLMRIVLIVVARPPSPRRLHLDDHQPAGPAAGVPVAAGVRRRQLRQPDDALERHHRVAVPGLAPRRPDVGLGQPRLRARRRVPQRRRQPVAAAGGDPLRRRQHRPRHPPVPRVLEHVPVDGVELAAVQRVAPRRRRRHRHAHRRRQRARSPSPCKPASSI